MTRHPADSRSLRRISGPPGASAPTRVYDALLVASPEVGTEDDFVAHQPVGDRAVALGRDLSIRKMDQDVAELIMNACTQRGHFYFAERQFGCLYAFVLEEPLTEARRSRWDPDDIIMQAVALSRLVRDNAYSTEYAARVTEYAGGEMSVFPHDGLESRHVYRLQDARDWLDHAETQALARLLARFWDRSNRLPRRLAQALWTTEHIAWERYFDIVLPALVSALEGMVNTDKRQVTRQFTTRVPALADELGIEGVSKNFCRKMYEARSQGAHGSAIDLFAPDSQRQEAVRKVALVQQVLRVAVRRGIEDPTFRALFNDDKSVRGRWPVPVRHRWRRWRRSSL